jgi:hypothetical protein
VTVTIAYFAAKPVLADSIARCHDNIIFLPRQSGLSEPQPQWEHPILTVVSFLMTMIGIALADDKRRKFLFVEAQRRAHLEEILRKQIELN